MEDASLMRRATVDEARAMRSQLVRWHSISGLRETLKAMAAPHGFYAASQGAMQFWREAWCACAFADQTGADSVRLHENDPPDFVLRIEGRPIECELAEIRAASSRTGYEFDDAARRHNAGNPPEIEHFDTEAHRLWLGLRVSEAIARKATKGYDKGVVLAIYVHAWVFDGQRDEADRAIAAAVAPFIANFAAIWVLTSGKLTRFGERAD